jgi:hypothetical protein
MIVWLREGLGTIVNSMACPASLSKGSCCIEYPYPAHILDANTCEHEKGAEQHFVKCQQSILMAVPR